MKYLLRRGAIGPQVVLDIDEERYRLLHDARLTLVHAGSFEQYYELLLGNFTGFEMYCAQASLKGALEFDFRYESFTSQISEANRHAINFLTTTRLYADQVVRNFRHLPLEKTFDVLAKQLLKDTYDQSLEYRFIWELRNYVQHRAFAVHGYKGRKGEHWLEGCQFYTQKNKIQEDRGDFKQAVLDELNEQIDLLAMFRGYMSHVSRVQISLRGVVSKACSDAREVIQQAMDDYCAVQQNEHDRTTFVGITATKHHEGQFLEPVNLMLDWDNARQVLSSKNIRPINPPKHPL